jgi:transposase
MRFYSKRHEFYVGIDLHARQMFVCVMDQEGTVLLHRNMPAEPKYLDQVLARFTGDVVVAVECIFSWYWIADYCEEREIPFVLGHALYMKAIHGTKSKNDRIDSQKIATMLRAGMLPQAYVYPRKMRATRDLLRRREYFMHQQSELLTHVTNTNTQYNYPVFEKRIRPKANRKDLAERFVDPSARKSIEADLHLLDVYHRVLLDLEAEIKRQATQHDPVAYQLLRTIPGVGPILALVILYEIHDISRFPEVGNFISYARLVKCAHESAGKRVGGGNNKIGNAHLKWAFSEAAVLFLRERDEAKRMHQKLVAKYGKAKALSIIAQKLGRTAYYILKRKEPFVAERFFGDGVREPAA